MSIATPAPYCKSSSSVGAAWLGAKTCGSLRWVLSHAAPTELEKDLDR